MSTFTKIILNGIEKLVAAIYDGSGNVITDTYETKEDAVAKETALNDSINTTNENLTQLTERVEVVESFNDSIETNAAAIAENASEIAALKEADSTTQTTINELTVEVTNAKNSAQAATTVANAANENATKANQDLAILAAVVNDEASGINALNTQADSNTAQIAVLEQTINTNKTEIDTAVLELREAVSNTISLEVYNALLARVEALEALNNTTEEPTEPEELPEGSEQE